MAKNWKPVIDEIKTKLANTNRDEIRTQLIENLKQGRLNVEKTLKTVAEEAKESRLVNEVVFPALESQRADQALEKLQVRLATTPLAKYDLVGKIKLARAAILSLKTTPTGSASEAETSEKTKEPSSTGDLAAEAKSAAAAFSQPEAETKQKSKKTKSSDTTDEA